MNEPNLQEKTFDRHLFEKAFESSAIGMALVSLNGKWIKVNESLCQILGYSKKEFLCLDFQSITHPDDLDADMTLVQEVLDGHRESYQMEKRYFHRNGSVVWATLSVALVRNEDGSPKFFISQIQDITARKKQ